MLDTKSTLGYVHNAYKRDRQLEKDGITFFLKVCEIFLRVFDAFPKELLPHQDTTLKY